MGLLRRESTRVSTTVALCAARGVALAIVAYISDYGIYYACAIGSFVLIYMAVCLADKLLTCLALYACFELLVAVLVVPVIVGVIGFAAGGELLASANLALHMLSADLSHTLVYLAWSVPYWAVLFILQVPSSWGKQGDIHDGEIRGHP